MWETSGLQVCPSPSLGQWFSARAAAGASGTPSSQDAPLTIDWCGKANGKKGYWNWDYGNLGPHVAFAWAPNRTEGFWSKLLGSGNKTSIRGGFGVVYDRFGQGIVDEFNGNSFGLTTSLSNPIMPLNSLPRLTSVNVIPPSLLQPNPGAPVFPETIPTMQSLGASNFGSSLDTSLKTPYSYTLAFSLERDLGAGFSLDLAYVGRLSRRLLSSQDVAQPLDLRDKRSGLDYFSAIQPLARLYELQGVTDATFSDSMVSPAVVKYWTNMLQAPSTGALMRWVLRQAVAVQMLQPRPPIPSWRSSIFFVEYQVSRPPRFRLLMCLSFLDSETVEYQTRPAIQTAASQDTRFASTIRLRGRIPSTTRSMCL